MKKILHLFSDPSHSALWSRYLRMLTLIALFAFGSHGVWGLGIKRNVSMTNISLPTTDRKGTFENKVYTWSDGSNNLIQLNDLNNTDLSEYESIVIPVSNWKSGTLRCLIRVNDNGTEKDFTCFLSGTNSESTPLLYELTFLKASFKDEDEKLITKEQLQHVKSVSFGGYYSDSGNSGTATIGQIYLTKQLDWDENGKITILPQDINCDYVTKNGNSFTFTQQYATVTIDFIGDGIPANKLASASSSENNSGYNIYYCIDDDYNKDKPSTSELGVSNVKKVKYAYQNVGSQTITINNFVLEYKVPITVTLKAENGTINGQTEKTIKYCETPITLPAATPNDKAKVFNAWRTDAHVGNAGDKYTPTENITLTAHYTNKTLWGDNNDQLGDYTKTVPMNTVFTPCYTISKNTQREFTFTCNRPRLLDAFWYGWVMWAKPTGSQGSVNSNPFYFWTNAQDTRYAEDTNTGIWTNSVSTDLKISKGGKLFDMTPDERVKFREDMCDNATVNVKVAYFDNTIRMYAVIKSKDSQDGRRTYVQAYTYNKASYINGAESIDVYFSVDHAYLTNFTAKDAINIIIVDGNIREYGIYVPEGAKNAGNGTCPVIISLHGRYGTVDPVNGSDLNFNNIEKNNNDNNIIVVYPQGRSAADKDKYIGYKDNWYYGFGGGTGWEATGKENGDTRFIEELVKEIKTKYPQANPKRFYLCGFSMGGMMTYACAKVLNGTFAAYGSCGGYPLNEFHLNLATKQPVPFIHLHGNSDGIVGINHLHTIIENLLFRNGCSLDNDNYTVDDQWDSQGFKKYDFTGVNNVPVTTVTFKDLKHSVAPSAPDYLWNFFKEKSLDTYQPTTMKWQWDMKTINGNLGDTNGNHYGWNRVQIAGGNNGTLTYGDNRKNNDNHNVYNSIQLEKGTYKLHAKANVVSSDATGIIVGIYKVGETENSGKCIIRRQVKNNSGTTSANLSILYPFTITEDGEYYVKVERGNNQTTCSELAIHTSDYAPDDEDDSEKVTELTSGWQTNGLIVKIDFEDVKKQDGTTKKIIDLIQEESGAIRTGGAKDKNGDYSYVLFTGEAPKYPDSSASDDSPKYDVYNFYCRHDGDIDKNTWGKSDVIHHDAIFGNYFQNIPKAQFFDRSAGQNYMRAVLPQKALSPIKESGAATIGFWVNGRVAVDAGLSYNDASMLYLSGAYHSNQYGTTGGTGKYEKEYQSMFNIRCNGNTNGFLKFFAEKGDSTQMRYFADTMFGDLCDNDINNIGKYYKKNLYLDRNWHYITMVMYNDLRNVDMYVDGELTQSRQNIVGSDQDLKAGLDTINHIIIGGLNATYTNFTYDPAFAFDDIVIYSRALSAQEIQEIIKEKNYSPTFWDFEKNIANTALLNKDKLKDSYWTYDQVNDVYTLSKQLTTAAELTYDGNRVIPAFRGLKFKATATEQIKIDMKKKRLIVVGKGVDKDAVEMTISNAPAGQYIRYKYDKGGSGWLQDWSTNTHKFIGDIWTSDFKIGITKVEEKTERQTCTCNVHGTINFKSIGSTDKEYADLCFGSVETIKDDKGNTKEEFAPTPKVTVETEDFSFTEPELHLFFNGLAANKKFITTNSNGQGLKDLTMTFWSSAPHVAYITSTEGNQPKVKATGVPGSAYIYAELVENNNQYDCNTKDADLYASSNRIIARYEIHVPNKVKEYSVKISADETHNDNDHKFKVGEALRTTDNAVTLTLGGWNYNSNTYFGSTDGYTKKETWKGMPLNKDVNDPNGYTSTYKTSGNYTDDNTYSGLGSYTGGTHAAKSEQLDGADNKGLFYTESVKNNSTAWTLPCRGSYAKVEPTEAGIISVYVLQEGCMERNMTGSPQPEDSNPKVAEYEPYDINIKKVYVADEAGNIIDDVITDTKSKIVSQVWKDDERARAEYSFYVSSTAYSLLLHERFLNNIVNPGGQDDAVLLLNKWNNPGMTQNIIKFGKGYGIVDKGIVRYTFNVLPGKTYYIFSNDAKMGIAGFNFTKNKQLNFNSKHEIIANDPLAGDLTPTESVTLDDTKDYSAPTDAKNANVTLNRTFYKNSWNAICLPYSINRRQIEKVFGDGTMVVLMNYIDTSKKKVMFIEHANQDIIAGYPYLIFPTDKADNDKTNHSVINNGIITTRATFGEANSPIFTVGTDGKTYAADNMQPNALVFKGTFTKADLPVGSYVITKSGTLANVPQTGLKINPYRAYIHFNQTTPEAKAIKLASMGFAGIDDMEGETTSIEDLLFNDGIMTRPADVFTVNGQKVRSKAKNLYGLPKGVYIVNGKKYVNK